MESDKSSLQTSDFEKLQFLVTDLWGPSSENQIHQFANIPFQPFNRSKINLAPFNSELNSTQKKHVGVQQQQQIQQQQHQQLIKEKQQQLNVTEDGFNQVQVKQSTKQKQPVYQKKNYRQNNKLYNEEQLPNQVKVQVKKVRKRKIKNAFAGYQRTKYVQFKDSVLIKSSFEPLCEIDKSIYEKTKVKEVLLEEIKRTGKLKEFNWTYNNITNKKPTDMPASTYVKQPKIIDSNAQKDQCLLDILQDNVDREEELQKQYEELQEKIANRKNVRQERRKAQNEGQQLSDSEDEKVKDEEPPTIYKNVYITDALLNGLLTLKNSEFPWDIKIYKENNTYFFDKFHEDNISYLDLDTMMENSTQKNILPTDENEVLNICRETTSVRKTLIKNATQKGAEWEYIPEVNEDEEEEEGEEGEEKETPQYIPNCVESVRDENVAFRYVKVTLDDQIQVFVRAKIDAYERASNDKKIPIICKAFTEYNPIKFDWRKKMNLSFGALASELQIFNLCELNKALMQMYLTDAQRIKLAYVSRDLRDINKSDKHSILKVDSYTYEELKHELKIDPQDSWQIIKYLINYLSKMEDGSYLLLKHSYKSSLHVYALPEGYDKPDSSDDELGDEDGEEVGEEGEEDEDEEQ
ncbi:hypothetical protein PPERSA_04159 [Pseudocohnilembus persalinus]|uniref:Uncharacterized protein n=1 Tax=Pseudocohnilembus persalinus TaxID=266149 RepID=A0A0V0QN70_PSEPJ|nr:hypothetical protein PPERSA_04159 [Pseudocohnilembus persalinus]|eukprot:KRX03607.1 hypothetical protein PPERSA_04159 [Pseudocohnilembus persalinus]